MFTILYQSYYALVVQLCLLEAFPGGNTWQQTFYDARMGAHDLLDYNDFRVSCEVLQCFPNFL